MMTTTRGSTLLAIAVLVLTGLQACRSEPVADAYPPSRDSAPRSLTVDEPTTDPQEAPSSMTARDVLLRMGATYGACRSYTDRVEQRSRVRGEGTRGAQSLTFATNFVRGGGFRIDLNWRLDEALPDERYVPHSQMVVWGDNASAREWWPQAADSVEAQPLGRALAHSAGVSAEASWTVPSLLLPGVVSVLELPLGPEGALALLHDPTLMGVESFAGHTCFKLRGTGPRHTTEMWIDSQSFVLRRISSTVVWDDGATVDRVTVYDPTLDADIRPSVFEFEPPK